MIWGVLGITQIIASYMLIACTYLPPSVYIFYGIKVYEKSIFLTTYPPPLVNIVCERPLSQKLQWFMSTLIYYRIWVHSSLNAFKVIIEKSRGGRFLWKISETWAGFKQVGNTEKKNGPIMSIFWEHFFHVFSCLCLPLLDIPLRATYV